MRSTLPPALGLVLVLSACSGAPAAPTPPAPTGSPAATLTVTSDAFTEGGQIPAAYTCRGAGQVPTIAWYGDLHGAAALAVVVDDPDAPGGTFVHRVVVDLPTTATSLGAQAPAGSHEARNSTGRTGWTPPCPPSGTHHYRFTVYGLNAPTGLADGASSAEAIQAITAKALVQGRLVGIVAA